MQQRIWYKVVGSESTYFGKNRWRHTRVLTDNVFHNLNNNTNIITEVETNIRRKVLTDIPCIMLYFNVNI